MDQTVEIHFRSGQDSEVCLVLVCKSRGQVLGLVRTVGKIGGWKFSEQTSKQKSHFGFKE